MPSPSELDALQRRVLGLAPEPATRLDSPLLDLVVVTAHSLLERGEISERELETKMNESARVLLARLGAEERSVACQRC
jgi:hypothetical protein